MEETREIENKLIELNFVPIQEGKRRQKIEEVNELTCNLIS